MASPRCLGGRDGKEDCGSDDCDFCVPRLEDRCPYQCDCCFRQNDQYRTDQCLDDECLDGFCRCRSPSPNGYSMDEFEQFIRESAVQNKVREILFYDCARCLHLYGEFICQCAEEPVSKSEGGASPPAVTLIKPSDAEAVCLAKDKPQCNGKCEGFCIKCCKCTKESESCFNCMLPPWHEIYNKLDEVYYNNLFY